MDLHFKKQGGIYTFTYTQTIDADIELVWDFFSKPKNLEKVSVAKSKVKVDLDLNTRVEVGLEFSVAMRVLGLINQVILTKVTQIQKPTLFEDVQVSGPFKYWSHKHFFEAKSQYSTIVKDEISFELPMGLIGSAFFELYLKKELLQTFKYREEQLRKLFPSV
jgi:ligand-binding SRPBCC domain-containing protein